MRSRSTYTLSETSAPSAIGLYRATYSCVDAANGNADAGSGTASSFGLTFPSTPGARVVCTFGNEPGHRLGIAMTANAPVFRPGVTSVGGGAG